MNNWFFKSIVTGMLSGLLSMILFPNLIFCISVFIIVTVIMILNNPKRRFIKAEGTPFFEPVINWNSKVVV
jgi:hypothetical protein